MHYRAVCSHISTLDARKVGAMSKQRKKNRVLAIKDKLETTSAIKRGTKRGGTGPCEKSAADNSSSGMEHKEDFLNSVEAASRCHLRSLTLRKPSSLDGEMNVKSPR